MPLQYFDIKTKKAIFVNEGDNPDAKIAFLERQNADLLFDSVLKDGKITEVERTQANLILDLTMKGVL